MKRTLRSFLLRPSTWAWIWEARRAPHYSLFDFLHGQVYARWLYLYIAVGKGEHRLSRLAGAIGRLISRLIPTRPVGDPRYVTFADTYHGKVVTPQAARQLVSVQKEISLTDLEQIIPYVRARDIILKNPDHIVVLECPCRSAKPNPCLPLDVCLVVGEPFAGFIAEHQPRHSRWITSTEAADILRAEHQRGHVHHAFFKDAMLGRFYAICNCCACCCGAMQAWQSGVPMLTASGYISRVDADQCTGCGTCAENCQFAAITVPEGTARVDAAKCMGCGVCVTHCEVGALSLIRDASKGEPLEIKNLIAQAEKIAVG